ncbi:hypothetical protein B5C34_09545 [Pacificimonas flava]|uniref:Uncharacterized protein n=2 Tax=Pacificimonas TaxID=1960290 RepID=A0A219B5Y4_9SPHN|nr:MULTISPECIES: hypothetical protein [Pacificimonas]MBZ6379085.1 hypothetical protein [Pacificimonas aurantium]OWV33681.1 hypothetical protein B5C34_09545 [Pacificimonas flava]
MVEETDAQTRALDTAAALFERYGAEEAVAAARRAIEGYEADDPFPGAAEHWRRVLEIFRISGYADSE